MGKFVINLSEGLDLHIEKGPIAVVDDDPNQKDLLMACHERASSNIDIIFFMTGNDLIAEVERYLASGGILPELILLDINMPGMNGFEVLKAVRAHDELSKVPLIVMHTTSDAEEDIRKAKELGANGFWSKPGRAKAYIEFFKRI